MLLVHHPRSIMRNTKKEYFPTDCHDFASLKSDVPLSYYTRLHRAPSSLQTSNEKLCVSEHQPKHRRQHVRRKEYWVYLEPHWLLWVCVSQDKLTEKNQFGSGCKRNFQLSFRSPKLWNLVSLSRREQCSTNVKYLFCRSTFKPFFCCRHRWTIHRVVKLKCCIRATAVHALRSNIRTRTNEWEMMKVILRKS